MEWSIRNFIIYQKKVLRGGEEDYDRCLKEVLEGGIRKHFGHSLEFSEKTSAFTEALWHLENAY